DPSRVIQAARSEILAFNPAIPIGSAKTLDTLIDDNLRQERMIAQLSTVFGGLALLLACIGLYGVLSYAVARRTNEIGIRMALGAQRGHVLWLVLREAFALVLFGVVIGLGAALAGTRTASALLFQLKPNDPLTIALATVLLLLVATLAGYLPARRAARVDPLVAL